MFDFKNLFLALFGLFGKKTTPSSNPSQADSPSKPVAPPARPLGTPAASVKPLPAAPPKPVAPAKPTAPPAKPLGTPAASAKPATPSKPVAPAKPAASAKPAAPAKPVPAKPAASAKPAAPPPAKPATAPKPVGAGAALPIGDRLIPLPHPNRGGEKLIDLLAVVVHYTANSRPGANAIMNARYFARAWKGTIDKPLEAGGKPFGYGSAHIICDQDQIVRAIPEDEVAWSCGDSHWLPKNNGFNGRQPIAGHLFNGKPNYYVVGVEICNNADWNAAAAMAVRYIRDFLAKKGRRVNVEASLSPQTVTSRLPDDQIMIIRHYDVSAKNCPAPFVSNPTAWAAFVRQLT